MTITLYDNETGDELGTIGRDQLNFLVEQLEEETSEDQDYWLRAETLDLLEERGGDRALIALLRKVLGDREGFEIRWEGEE